MKEDQIILSLMIVMLGWFVISFLNRRHEIAKIRMALRIDTMKHFILYFRKCRETKSYNIKEFNKIQLSFYLHGYDDEIDLVDEITKLFTINIPTRELSAAHSKLMNLSTNRLRKELGLSILHIRRNKIKPF